MCPPTRVPETRCPACSRLPVPTDQTLDKLFGTRRTSGPWDQDRESRVRPRRCCEATPCAACTTSFPHLSLEPISHSFAAFKQRNRHNSTEGPLSLCPSTHHVSEVCAERACRLVVLHHTVVVENFPTAVTAGERPPQSLSDALVSV